MGTPPANPDISPHMFAVDFERLPRDLGFTVIVLATSPLPALEKVFKLFPEYRPNRRGHVHEIEYAEIDWETGRAFVIQVKNRPLNLRGLGDARQGPKTGELEGGKPL